MERVCNGKRKRVLAFALSVLMTLGATFGLLSGCGPDDIQADPRKNVVYFDGEPYVSKKLATYLVMGVDTEGETDISGYWRNNEQADFIALIVANRETRTLDIVQINRDTMAIVNELGYRKTGSSDYSVVRQTQMQIALAHTYGDGGTSSCKNVLDAVRLLLASEAGTKIPIDYYISMTMTAVSELVNALTPNGVQVTLDEDQDYSDYAAGTETWTPGNTITLTGSNALTFVRARIGADDWSNLARQHRQQQFMRAFLNAIYDREVTNSMLKDVYNAVNPYIVTNCDRFAVEDAIEYCIKYHFSGEFISPEGEARLSEPDLQGRQYMEYYVNDTPARKAALLDLVKTTFYKPKNQAQTETV